MDLAVIHRMENDFKNLYYEKHGHDKPTIKKETELMYPKYCDCGKVLSNKQQAKLLGVDIKLSTNSKKKLDVFRNNIKIATIGDVNYDDYPTYLIKFGKSYAEEKRRLYKLRHENNMNKVGSNGFYASRILW